MRTLRDYALKHRVLAGLGAELTCGLEEVPAVVRKLREAGSANAREAGALRERLAQRTAIDLLRGALRLGEPPMTCVGAQVGDEPVEYLRALANAVTAQPDAVAIVAGRSGDGLQIVAQRGRDARLDCGAAVKRIAQACGGRGGGRPERAEGRVPAGADVLAAIEAEWRLLEP
jgi:alanyl-tRNA synthetase